MSEAELRQACLHLYEQILQTANRFLTQGKVHSVQFLATKNPTFSEIARLMEETASVISALSSRFDPMLHSKALDYCSFMVKMGAAIAEKNQSWLDELCAELERKPFL